MPERRITAAAILAFAAAALLLATVYGPLRRTFVSPPRVAAVATAAEAYELWKAGGIRGRIALVFSRHLVPARYGLTETERAAVTPGVEAIERAMHHAMVREVYHVVPDAQWQPLAFDLSHVSIYWPTRSGLVAAFEDGRVNVVPFARLWPLREPTLVLLDARDWSREELGAIARRIGSGAITTDLVAVLNGTSSDLELLAAAQAAMPRP